ncbi:hypothetical protein RMS29_027060 (plasmid) [Agrobacterium rosae]|uniref:Uncharacterized protein n=1 Tax=Agrobacterium rosae TaxID=1972867 RepID=A0ABU4W2U7_9HYPH|nr:MULTISPECIES: hypothetical protein [Rhizobium/Agrobacterium group]MDX8332110.1 hypothetical protein [Agrobacterium rosae]WCJ66076.1 hypothetical protein G6M15_24955 [Agrobacterium tumefaciens]WCK17132.1 hypothetical protein G6L41_026610 [Agrobacterium tumefaciens]
MTDTSRLMSGYFKLAAVVAKAHAENEQFASDIALYLADLE